MSRMHVLEVNALVSDGMLAFTGRFNPSYITPTYILMGPPTIRCTKICVTIFPQSLTLLQIIFTLSKMTLHFPVMVERYPNLREALAV